MDEVIYGEDIQVFINGKMMACGTSISVKGTRKEIPTTCAGSGDIETATLGKAKYTFDIQGVWRRATGAEVAANVTTFDVWKLFMQKNEVVIQFKSELGTEPEAEMYIGTGYIKDVGSDGQVEEAGKFSLSGFFNEFDATKAEPVELT